MSYVYTFIEQGERETRRPLGSEHQRIRNAVLQWLRNRELCAPHHRKMSFPELLELGLSLAGGELRLPLTERCVWIRRAE